jgi:hypothetical protein
MPRPRAVAALALAFLFVSAPAALGCAALIGPKGAVRLGKTTTLAGYHAGVEHYITAFTFEGGGGGKFGSIVPLPGIPTKIEKGGNWTLQRLVRETEPQPASLTMASAARGSAVVIQKKRIDALDLTVVKGGGDEVAAWARKEGFILTPDAPAALRYYARRSPIFMAATFDAEAARQRQQQEGDGTPVHLTIPTSNPWVPLRILAVGAGATDVINAEVYLLTDRRPALLPVRAQGWTLERRVPASAELLRDLRTDKGMQWLPERGMWLTHFDMSAPAQSVRYDLAVDASGRGRPSWEAAGLVRPPPPTPAPTPSPKPTVPPQAVPSLEPAQPVSDLGAGVRGGVTVAIAAVLVAAAAVLLKRRTT